MNLLPSTLTADIQEIFSQKYPLLMIKFYNSPHKEYEGSKPSEEVLENKALQELNHSITKGKININDEVSVNDLESEFENKFGLHVQVFRRSGDIWLQTSKTDYWTLGKHQQVASDTIKRNEFL